MSAARGRWFGRRRHDDPADVSVEAVAEAAAESDEECIPCGKQARLRPFALNVTTAASIDDDLVPVLTDRFAFAILAGEVVLFDPDRSTSMLLNSAAALVWATIDDGTTVAAIIDDLAAETGAERAVIDADVRATLARFADAGIIEPVAPTAAPDEPPAPASDPATGAALAVPTAAPPSPAASAGDELDRRAARRADRTAAALERIDWCAGPGPRRCSTIGVEVRTNDPDLAATLADVLGALAPASEVDAVVSVVARRPGSTRPARILVGTELRTIAGSTDAIVDAVVAELNRLAAEHPSGGLVLHAGAVARDGDVVVVAGPSGRGKSTLTAALVQRGFTYLSDEVATVDPQDRTVVAYPKPLDLDAAAIDLLGLEPSLARPGARKSKVGVDHLSGDRHADPTATVRLLVLLEDPRDPEAGDGAGAPRRSPAESLVALLTNTFSSTFATGTSTQDPLGALAALTADVAVLHLGRTSIDEACAAIEGRLDAIVAAPA